MIGQTPVPELQRRLIYALLQPALALCRRFRVPLDEVEQLCRIGYYEEIRRKEGFTQARVAQVFGKSLRTVGQMERALRTDFLAPTYEVELSRKVEERLGAGPVTIAALAEELDAPPDDIERVLIGLVAAAHAIRETDETGERYVLSERFQSLVRDDQLARIDGLKHQLEVLTAAVQTRFFGSQESSSATARTLAFMGTPEDVDVMATELIRTVRLQAIEVEEKALQGEHFQRYAVTLALTPTQEPETR